MFISSLQGQSLEKPDYSKIDMMLIRGEFNRVIDTCTMILEKDTINPEVYYKLGTAYQNILSDDKSLECFLKAATLSPDNNTYNFTLAKSYFNKGKTEQSKEILERLCASDSTNWPYAYYLTSIYMQEENYEESIKIYYRFYKKDYFNYLLTDKIGYALLKKGDSEKAIDLFNKSLEINSKDINAIKNLAYLYAGKLGADTAVKLLTKGIEIDPADIDLYARRAAINYTVLNYKKALVDYLKVLSSGDSSVLNLKRAGISFAFNSKPEEAVTLLQKAYQKDSSDYETVHNLALNYRSLKEIKKSIYYYNRCVKMLSPEVNELGLNYILLGEALKSGNQYTEAINAYRKSQEFRSDNSVYMIIANLYDEKLNESAKAIHYYELYLSRTKNSKDKHETEYQESITKRIESLKKQDKTNKK